MSPPKIWQPALITFPGINPPMGQMFTESLPDISPPSAQHKPLYAPAKNDAALPETVRVCR